MPKFEGDAKARRTQDKKRSANILPNYHGFAEDSRGERQKPEVFITRGAKDTIIIERTFDNVQSRKFPVHDSKIFNQDQARSFDQTEIPLQPRREEVKRRSSVYDKTPDPPTDKSRRQRENGLNSDQKQERREPSFLEIEDKARAIYDTAIKNEIINNREQYEYQKRLGRSPMAWEQLDRKTKENYRNDAYDDILAEEKRNAPDQKKSTHERSRPKTRDTYVEKEYMSRPPLTRRDSKHPKRSSSMNRADTTQREEIAREEPRPMKPERQSVYEQFRRTSGDTYPKKEEDRSRPPLARGGSTRPKRSSSMSKADTTRPKENFDVNTRDIQKQNTRVYSHKREQDSAYLQPVEAEKPSLTKRFLKIAEEEWRLSGAHGGQRELDRIKDNIRRTPWKEIEPEKHKDKPIVRG